MDDGGCRHRRLAIGELEVLVAEPVLGEVVDEIAPLFVGDGCGADTPVEVDVLEHALERWVVGFERLVQPVTDLMVKIVADLIPPALWGYEEGVPVVVWSSARRSASCWLRP